MRRVLDLLVAVKGAGMGGDAGVAVHAHTYALQGGEHHQGSLCVGMRNGVVVEIEAHVRGLADVDFHAFFARERLIGQIEQR